MGTLASTQKITICFSSSNKKCNNLKIGKVLSKKLFIFDKTPKLCKGKLKTTTSQSENNYKILYSSQRP